MNSKQKVATSEPKEFIPNCSEANKFESISGGIEIILAGQISQVNVISL